MVILKDGTTVKLRVGEDPEDPVLTITDLLPHLGADQMQKKASEVVTGEELNVLIGSIPFPGGDEIKERFKLGVLQLLFEKYGVAERDLVTAEIEIVPAAKARCVGIDRSFVGGYGQDDRVCAYTALRALIDLRTTPKRTAMVVLYDKEETGSGGVTGARSQLFPSVQKRMVRSILGREPSAIELQDQIEKSAMLSSDVAAAFDPTFIGIRSSSQQLRRRGLLTNIPARAEKAVHRTQTPSSSMKSASMLDDSGIPRQCGELGKVDQGGGGTVRFTG